VPVTPIRFLVGLTDRNSLMTVVILAWSSCGLSARILFGWEESGGAHYDIEAVEVLEIPGAELAAGAIGELEVGAGVADGDVGLLSLPVFECRLSLDAVTDDGNFHVGRNLRLIVYGYYGRITDE
jgi:hypothetical protein